MAELSKELATEIKKLEDCLSMKIVNEVYSPADFGNAVITMRGPDASLRFVRERGQVFVDLGKTNGDWVDANEVLERAHLHPYPGQPIEPVRIVNLVCSNYDQLKPWLAD
jgi:hypothetical protein